MHITTKGKHFLSRFTNSCESFYPNYRHAMKLPNDLSIDNASEVACATETWNQAYEAHHVMINAINNQCNSNVSAVKEVIMHVLI